MIKATRLRDLRDTNQRGAMNRDQSEMFIKATLLEHKSPIEFDSQPLGILGQILRQRLDLAQPPARVTLSAALVALDQSGGNPGKVVSWAFMLWRMYAELGRTVTLADLTDAFPLGFPTQAGFEEIWDGQKGSGGNGYDDPANWRQETS